jgi:outer membrane receptor for ferrienterochelin and colicins
LNYRDFTLEAAFNRREKDNPTAQYFTAFNVSGLQTTDDRGYVNLKLAHEFPGIVDVTAQVYYDYCDHTIGYPFGTNGVPFYKEKETGEWWGTELQLSKRIWDKHTFILGAEYRDDFRQDDRVYEPSTGQTTSESHQDRQSYGVYAEGDVTLLDNLHLNAGVRYDQYGDFDPRFNPRVALVYGPFEKSTFKAIYGTAFRVPNFLELSDPRFQNISPEEITSYQLVYEQGIGRNLRSSISGFYNQMNNLIVFEDGNYGNIDAESKGVELALEGTWASGLRGRASYTLQSIDNGSASLYLPDSPEQLIKLNVSVPIIKEKLFAGLEFQYTSARNTFYTDPTTQATLPGINTVAFSVVNFTLFSQNLVKNLDISASIYNLFNEHYADPATASHLQDQIPQDGRTLRLKLTYRF